MNVQSGANVVLNSNANLVLNNTGLTNSGTISSGGTVVFSGTSAASATPLSSNSALANITLAKTAGGVALVGNTAVSNVLQLSGGVLNLNGFNLDLGAAGSINGENNATYITGTTGGFVTKTVTLNSPNAANPGNLGLSITSAANLGSTVIRRGHQQQVSSTGYGILRYYDIVPTNNSGLNATVAFRFLDGELAGIVKSDLKFYSSQDNGVNWQLLGIDGLDVNNNIATKNSINSFARLTLGSSANNPLPVQLLSFTAAMAANGVEVKWTTANEINNSHFEVEKSDNGSFFTRFATVASQGSGPALRNYLALDNEAFFGVRYYRLKQVDKDGRYIYSRVVAVNKGRFVNKLLNVYPNPAVGPVHVRFTSAEAAGVTIQVVNAHGQLLLSRDTKVQQGLNEVVFDSDKLPAGVYYIRLSGLSNETLQFIKSR